MFVLKRGFLRTALAALLCASLSFVPVDFVQAKTIYLSDETAHEEGYIIIGESHIVLTSDAYERVANENHQIAGLNDVFYQWTRDGSLAVDEEGGGNTFTMKGNLFFVFEGNASNDADLQTSREYIYSDGKGNRGAGVSKIHEIINSNPNISHWNIISYHGAVSALEGSEAGKYYVDSYKNWIGYEFPTSSVYFVSHSTMTKFYKQNRKAYLFDEEIKNAFPSQYFDMTAFYKSRYPQQMMDPNMNPDTIHWTHATYVELFNYVISCIQSEAYTTKCRLLRNRIFLEHTRYDLQKALLY